MFASFNVCCQTFISDTVNLSYLIHSIFEFSETNVEHFIMQTNKYTTYIYTYKQTIFYVTKLLILDNKLYKMRSTYIHQNIGRDSITGS